MRTEPGPLISEDSRAALCSTGCATRLAAAWPPREVTAFLRHWNLLYFYQSFPEEEIKTSVSFSQAIVVAIKVYKPFIITKQDLQHSFFECGSGTGASWCTACVSPWGRKHRTGE